MSWDIASYLDTSLGNKDLLFNVLKIPELWDSVEQYPDSYLALMLMNEDENIDLYITTSTYRKTLRAKYDKLLDMFPFINEDQIVTIHKKSLLGLDFLIDDRPLDFLPFEQILMSRPHNENIHSDNRVNDLTEAYQIIKESNKYNIATIRNSRREECE